MIYTMNIHMVFTICYVLEIKLKVEMIVDEHGLVIGGSAEEIALPVSLLQLLLTATFDEISYSIEAGGGTGHRFYIRRTYITPSKLTILTFLIMCLDIILLLYYTVKFKVTDEKPVEETAFVVSLL